jgi:ketosteroid isomerase-like protein
MSGNDGAVRGVRYRVSVPDERVSQRRTLDERLFAPIPSVYRLLAAGIARLPPRSRLRGSMLTRLVCRATAAANRRDFDLLLAGFDREIEYHPRDVWLAVDMDAVYRGHGGYRQVWREILDAFEDIRLEPEEILDFGDWLLATVHTMGHGSGSGVPVSETVYQLFRLRRGLVVWQQDFVDRDEALEAAGLRDSSAA